MDYARELVGAFYAVFMHAFPRVQIRVDEEQSPGFRSFYGARGMREQLLNVVVEHPYVHADPRPEDERKYPMGFAPGERAGYRQRLVRVRPPCVLQTVVPPGQTSIELQRHALAAFARFLEEEARGYAVIRNAPLPTATIAGERPALCAVTGDAEPGELVLHRTTAEPILTRDAYALASGGEVSGIQMVKSHYRDDGVRVIDEARLLTWGPSTDPLPQLPRG